MNAKVHFQLSHLNYFHGNLEDLGERFHEDLKYLEMRYQKKLTFM